MKKAISFLVEFLACFGASFLIFVAWVAVSDPEIIQRYMLYVSSVLGCALVILLLVVMDFIPEKKNTRRKWRVYTDNKTGERFFEWKDDSETITLLLDGGEEHQIGGKKE